jgi:mono/diheme cytochrome c family protein
MTPLGPMCAKKCCEETSSNCRVTETQFLVFLNSFLYFIADGKISTGIDERCELACAMRQTIREAYIGKAGLFFLVLAFGSMHYLYAQTKSPAANVSRVLLHEKRASVLDLGVSGDLAGVPAGAIRYLRREDLLSLPQVSYTVTDDANFKGPTQVSGVSLEELVQRFSQHPQADLVVAICEDLYRAHYSRSYITAHAPLLVLLIDGKDPQDWPKYSGGQSMGPYLISHPVFTSRSKVLSQPEEPQIPWGVIRLEFRNEKKVFGAIAPPGPNAEEPAVQDGYHIAQQNCFRCHNMGAEGGEKAKRPWLVLTTWATASPEYFGGYVRDPKSKNPRAQMPGNPDYDDATIRALISYFRSFGSEGKP